MADVTISMNWTGPLTYHEIRKLGAMLEAEGLTVALPEPPVEERGGWTEPAKEVLELVVDLKIIGGAAAAKLVTAVFHRWRESRNSDAPPVIGVILGPDGEALQEVRSDD